MSGEPLTFSVRLPSGTPSSEFVAAATAAESVGFDQIWTGNDQFKRSGIVPVTLALAATSRIRVGSSVLNPVTLHPIEIASLVAGLQDVSGGRYLLGLGAGSEVYLRWAALDLASPVARTRRGLRIVKALLEDRPVADLPGEEGWSEQARLIGPPVPATPVYVGAMGPKMLAMAGREADGVLALCLPPSHVEWVREQVGTPRASAFDLACCIWVSIDDDADAARERLRPNVDAHRLEVFGVSSCRGCIRHSPRATALPPRRSKCRRRLAAIVAQAVRYHRI
ncbi:MAG: hypothetical protein CL424_12970 [Acidimicrobiaceae bacterium]|nr:hypothetical protein [Acidimicrobiaceae bacterium]